MPRSHKGIVYPNHYRRDLWDGTVWRNKFPETLRLSFLSWRGTYGLILNTEGNHDIPNDGWDASTMEISWTGFLHLTGHANAAVVFKAKVDPTTHQLNVEITIDFDGGPHVHGYQLWTFAAHAAPWNVSWNTGPGGTMTTTDPSKFRSATPGISIMTLTGKPY